MSTESSVLIAGFEPYSNYSYNPSKVLVQTHPENQSLQTSRFIMPVDDEAAYEMLRPELDTSTRSVLLFGARPGAAEFTFEQWAHNYYCPDEGNSPRPVDANGAGVHAATLRYGSMIGRLRRFGVRARPSSCPGGFVCNATFYRVLQWVQTVDHSPSVGFVHVPPFAERPMDGVAGPDKSQHHWVFRSIVSML